MDETHAYTRPLLRRWPTGLPVTHLGHHPRKTWPVRRSYNSCNLSIILDGNGIYRHGNRTWLVRAPAAFIQWPNEPMDYQPEPRWRELYVDFPPEAWPQLRSRGWFNPQQPCWQISDGAAVRAVADRLLTLMRRLNRTGTIDLVDRAAEELCLVAYLHADTGEPAPALRAVRAIRDRILAHPADHHDLHALAQQHGLGRGAWQRWWQREVGMPPHRFLVEQRLAMACRLLVETAEPVTSIARTCAFADPLYFARRFRSFAGCTATAYRARHRSPA